MSNKLTPAHLVPSQVPEFVVTEGAKFIDFIQKYYEFQEEYSLDIEKLRDVDLATGNLATLLLSEYASKFPINKQVSVPFFIRVVKEIYKSKGTTRAIELLFKLFYNTQVAVKQPSQSILRASDGKWIQDKFISVRTVYSTIQDLVQHTIEIDTGSGRVFIEPLRVTPIGNNSFTVFFSSNVTFSLEEAAFANVYDSGGTLVYKGEIIKSPSKLIVVDKGKGWKVGQLITVPSSISTGTPSFAKVVSVDALGGINAIDIVEYGGPHVENSVIIASPYKEKPASTGFDLVTEITGIDGEELTYAYTINLTDSVADFDERIVGVGSVSGADAYGIEFGDSNDYFDQDYNGKELVSRSISYLPNPTSSFSSISYEDWVESQATLLLQYDFLVKTPGKYFDDSSKLSNKEIRLQDNFYYQLFSYVIDSTVNLNESKGALSLVHPSGNKRFNNFVKLVNIPVSVRVERFFSKDRVHLADEFSVIDNGVTLNASKQLSDTGSASDSVEKISTATTKVSNASASDSLAKEVTIEVSVDTQLVRSDVTVGVGLSPESVAQTSEEISFSASTTITDPTTASDSISLGLNGSVVNDVVGVLSTETAVVTESFYSDLAYVESGYVAKDINLALS